MAGTEDEQARLIAQANYELSVLGRVSEETQEALADNAAGVKGLTKATKLAYTGVKQLGDAVGKTASAMYKGEKGAAAFNGALDSVGDAADSASKAMFAIAGPWGLVLGAITWLIGKSIKAVKVVNEQIDKEYNAFQELGKSGLSASDGMTGVYDSMKKMRVNVMDAGTYLQLMTANSKELALFGGTAFEGRKKLADVSAGMEDFRLSMNRMGMTEDDQREALMTYIKNETIFFRTQGKTAQELAESAKAYIKEQDALTRLTGVDREARAKSAKEAMSRESYAATLAQLRKDGQGKQAENLEAANAMLRDILPETTKGLEELSSGNAAGANASKLFGIGVGTIQELQEKVKKGEITKEEYAQKIVEGIKEYSDRQGTRQALIGQNDQYALAYTEQQTAQQLAQGDYAKNYKKALEDSAKARDKPDETTDNMAKAQKANTDAMLNSQALLQQAAPAVSTAMVTMAEAAASASERLLAMTGTQPAVNYGMNDESGRGEALPADLNAQYEEANKKKIADAKARRQAPAPSSKQVSQQQLAEQGLRIKRGKEGDVQTKDGLLSAKLLDIAKQVQSSVPGFAYFSGFNDNYHQEKAPESEHTKGLAADFALASAPDDVTGKKIVEAIKGMGASLVIDEYNHPSSKATAGHIHFQVPETNAAQGGVFPAKAGGTHVLIAEGGEDEAVIPMKNGAVQVSMKNSGPLADMAHPNIDTALDQEFSNTVSMDIKEDLRSVVMDIVQQLRPVNANSSGMSQAVLDQLDRLISYQKEANDIDNRMLAVTSN